MEKLTFLLLFTMVNSGVQAINTVLVVETVWFGLIPDFSPHVISNPD